jgi:alpha,alpha-trehalase
MKIYIHKKNIISDLIQQEDTTNSNTITIDDEGKKEFEIRLKNGGLIQIKGTYHLANLLQEAALLSTEEGIISLKRITEKPTKRISRLIKKHYWKTLTRSTNKESLLKVLQDEKRESDVLRIYIPENDEVAKKFYTKNSFAQVKIEYLPQQISNDYIQQHISKPGILSLSIDKIKNKSIPYIVPGGRFNEMYGWDSYFIALGLMIDNKYKLTKGVIENLEYQILNYGKILNANRNYYLSRSQPPFFSSLIKQFYEKYIEKLPINWLEKKLSTVITEYNNVWMTKGIRQTENNLNRYFGEGKKIPYETEKGHFSFILEKYAKKHKCSLDVFEEKYNTGQINEPKLDEYFIHDRSMRESGHDTTTRLDNVSAHLNPVSLNSLLFKFETDFAYLIKTYFNDVFIYKDTTYTSKFWLEKSNTRKKLINDLLWCKIDNNYYDYNYKKQEKHQFLSSSSFYPLWAKLCTKEQAEKLIETHLPKVIYKGGIASTEDFLKNNSKDRQWDFPYGWAPHQMLIWEGLINYGYKDLAQELIYRWLWLIVKTAVNYNGLIPEKFNVKECTHKTNVEYGNVGTVFKYVPDGGFGWTNASYKLGIKRIEKKYIKHLNILTDPNLIFQKR